MIEITSFNVTGMSIGLVLILLLNAILLGIWSLCNKKKERKDIDAFNEMSKTIENEEEEE